MSQALLQKIGTLSKAKKMPELQAGYTIKISQKIKEGDKQRVQSFEGLIIKLNSGYGADATVTVRKLVDGIGVEKIFPLSSPSIDKIQVIKKGRVRKAKLYYMRDLTGKSARLKETWLKETVDEAIKKAVEEEKVAALEETAAEMPTENVKEEEIVSPKEEVAEAEASTEEAKSEEEKKEE